MRYTGTGTGREKDKEAQEQPPCVYKRSPWSQQVALCMLMISGLLALEPFPRLVGAETVAPRPSSGCASPPHEAWETRHVTGAF